MTASIANDFRDKMKSIIAANWPVPDAITPIRVDHVRAADATLGKLEARVAQLESENKELRTELGAREHRAGFEIDTTRERPAYVALERARIDRLHADDQRAREVL